MRLSRMAEKARRFRSSWTFHTPDGPERAETGQRLEFFLAQLRCLLTIQKIACWPNKSVGPRDFVLDGSRIRVGRRTLEAALSGLSFV